MPNNEDEPNRLTSCTRSTCNCDNCVKVYTDDTLFFYLRYLENQSAFLYAYDVNRWYLIAANEEDIGLYLTVDDFTFVSDLGVYYRSSSGLRRLREDIWVTRSYTDNMPLYPVPSGVYFSPSPSPCLNVNSIDYQPSVSMRIGGAGGFQVPLQGTVTSHMIYGSGGGNGSGINTTIIDEIPLALNTIYSTSSNNLEGQNTQTFEENVIDNIALNYNQEDVERLVSITQLLPYHYFKRKNFSGDEDLRIGAEFEFSSFPKKLNFRLIYRLYGLCIEKDSSVKHEVITPVLNFRNIHDYIDRLEHLIFEGNTVDNTCGGHISISNSKMNGFSLSRKIGLPNFAILGALYPDRCNNSYCYFGKPTRSERKVSFRLDGSFTGSRIEIRLFPGTSSKNKFKWRVSLLDAMIGNDINKVNHLLFNSEHSEVPDYYSNEEMFTKEYDRKLKILVDSQ